jgi:hypothetical protein
MMQTIHRTTIVGKCPHGCPDLYAAEFHVEDRVIMVEDIQAAIDDLTQALADRLSCVVETRGVHGRFLTECRAEPKEA